MEQKENTSIVHLLRHVVSHAMTDRLDLSSKLFQTMDSADFMLMLILARHSQADQKKIYMKDLAEETKLPLRRVSDIARTLASQEWVSWKFDGNHRKWFGCNQKAERKFGDVLSKSYR